MVDRVLGETSVASPDMVSFAKGRELTTDFSYIQSYIRGMIEHSGSAGALVLYIDEGQRWWSTRLFLLSSLLRSLTAVRQVVFCHFGGRFAGMATPAAIVDGLAGAFPMLDELARKPRQDAPSSNIEREVQRQISAWPSQAEGLTIKGGVRAPLLERWLGERWSANSRVRGPANWSTIWRGVGSDGIAARARGVFLAFSRCDQPKEKLACGLLILSRQPLKRPLRCRRPSPISRRTCA
jgi:hypothetical protein